MRPRVSLAIALAAAALGSAACATSNAPQQLASDGVGVADRTEKEIDDFVARNNRLYELRLGAVKRLAIGDITANAATSFENYTVDKAGMDKQAGFTKLIRDLADFRAAARDKALKEQIEVEKTLALPPALQNTSKEQLQKVRNAFQELAEELSIGEWLKIATDYGQQVNGAIKDLKKQADEAEKKAKTAATDTVTK